ncbi:MAG: metallophosphoesterase, partial [Clostridia bacterium]|nr:metallophosphoesterase [Clostridia bacterium]
MKIKLFKKREKSETPAPGMKKHLAALFARLSSNRKTIFRAAAILATMLAVAFLAVQAWEALTDQSTISETFYQIDSDKLINDTRAVFLSDLHLSEFGEDNIRLVERVRLLKPDIILIGGDMNIYGNDDYSVVLTLCRQLVEIADTYYALGNHELTQIVAVGRQIYDDIEATGVVMLNDQYKNITVNGNAICLGGLSESGANIDRYSNDIIGRVASQDGYKILMSHYPSNFDLVAQSDIDLVLSGHLHGGQVNLPYLDGLYSYEDGFFPPYTEGMFEKDDTKMIVSRGLGNSHSLPRVNNPPELVIVDLNCNINARNTLQLLSALYASEQDEARQTSRETETGGYLSRLLAEKELQREMLSQSMNPGQTGEVDGVSVQDGV